MNKRKKLAAIALLLMILLGGCSSNNASEAVETGNFAPENSLTPGTVASESVGTIASEANTGAIASEANTGSIASEANTGSIASETAAENLPVDVPVESEEPESAEETAEPEETAAPTEEPFTYSLIPISDRSMGFIYAYPEGWVNLPGKSTICYRESVEAGDFPARVAVVKKSVAHTPKSSKVFSEFQSFAETIQALYDEDTFEFINQSTDATFMGQQAYETYYLGYSGDIEIKGYMIACGIDNGSSHYIMIYHFCASYEDFSKMTPMMKQMRDTVMFAD